MSYGPDRWLYPIEINSSNYGLAFDDNGFVLNTTIPAGTYYAHKDVTLHASYPSLYLVIQAALDAASLAGGDASTFTITAATPTGAPDMINGGIKIATDPGKTMTWLASGTINKTGAMGYQYGGADSDEAQEVVSPFLAAGKWDAPEWAADKRKLPARLLSFATEFTERQDAYVLWRADREVKRFIYELIPAAHVFESRALDAQYAQAAGLATGDTHNAIEALWRAASLLEDLIVIQRQASESLSLAVIGQGYEIVRLASLEAAQELSAWLTLQITGGELYRIEIPTVILDGGDYNGQ